jgi:DNA-binding response OmpR family regulator
VTAHILLIDDDKALVQNLLPVMAHLGYRVDQMAFGLDAIRKMLIDEPDVVILGVDPPQAGWQFCHQLLTFLQGPSLLLLLSTADEQDRVKGLGLGADDCMVKPVSTGELVARVETLLRRRAGHTVRVLPA